MIIYHSSFWINEEAMQVTFFCQALYPKPYPQTPKAKPQPSPTQFKNPIRTRGTRDDTSDIVKKEEGAPIPYTNNKVIYI